MAHYEILASCLKEVTSKIDRIIKKCVKEGISYTYEISDPYEKKVVVKQQTYLVKYVSIDIECFFKHNGWSVLGSVSRKNGIVQCYFDNPDYLKEYHDTDFHCDHCHKNVRRNFVVLLEHENGEKKLVGSSCVKEFTDGLDGDLIVNYASLLDFLNDDCRDRDFYDDVCSSGTPIYQTLDVVSCAASIIRQHGYTSVKQAEENPDLIPTRFFISDTLKHYGEDVSHDDEELANKAITWCASLSEDDFLASSYMFNLNQLCKSEYCTYEHFGLLASLIPSYKKKMYEHAKKGYRKMSDYVGSVKDKLNLNVQLVARPSYDSSYGTCYIYIMKDDGGNILVWKTNKYFEYKIGSVFNVKGIVKEHSVYNNEKQTVLTRCSLENIS